MFFAILLSPMMAAPICPTSTGFFVERCHDKCAPESTADVMTCFMCLITAAPRECSVEIPEPGDYSDESSSKEHSEVSI